MISPLKNLQVSENFWCHLQHLVETSEIVIDRPRGTSPSHYPAYAHLKNTSSADSSEIDIWVGSSGPKKVDGILCIIDMDKRDSEIKILFSCTENEIDEIYELQSQGNMSAVLVRREDVK